jgi:hypothetical protein
VATRRACVLVALAIGCSPWSKGPDWVVARRPRVSVSSERLGELNPERGVVLDTDDAVRDVLLQCSRPSGVYGRVRTWTPTAAQVAALDRLLPAFLSAYDARPPVPLPEYYRQYVGYLAAGHWYIYANFFPESHLRQLMELAKEDPAFAPPQWKTSPVVVCDGGSSFWGVSFDVDAQAFRGLAFNGSVAVK